jgi:hypothetical protein
MGRMKFKLLLFILLISPNLAHGNTKVAADNVSVITSGFSQCLNSSYGVVQI